MSVRMTPEDDAFERGKREAFVSAELDSHERRLNAINGSIDRHAREAIRLRNSITTLGDKVDSVITTLETKRAVDTALQKQVQRANEQQISNRTFWLGVIAIMATLVAAIIASHGGVFA